MEKAFFDHTMNYSFMTMLGQGKVTAVPDLAVLRLGVQTNGDNLSDVQYENATVSQAVLDGLRQMGVSDIKTFQYSIDKLYDYVEGNRIDRGYTVRNILEIRTNQMNQVGAIIDTAVANGANVVDFISFEVSEPDFYYQQALNLAVLNAIQKARSIAMNLGFPDDPFPTSITENSTAPTPYPQPISFREGMAATPIEPGSKEIEASVTVDFMNIGRVNSGAY
jgi:hypothetical protein